MEDSISVNLLGDREWPNYSTQRPSTCDYVVATRLRQFDDIDEIGRNFLIYKKKLRYCSRGLNILDSLSFPGWQFCNDHIYCKYDIAKILAGKDMRLENLTKTGISKAIWSKNLTAIKN